MNATIHQITEELRGLPHDRQQDVLRYVRQIRGAGRARSSGRDLLRFAHAIPKADVEKTRQAIEEGCERGGVSI